MWPAARCGSRCSLPWWGAACGRVEAVGWLFQRGGRPVGESAWAGGDRTRELSSVELESSRARRSRCGWRCSPRCAAWRRRQTRAQESARTWSTFLGARTTTKLRSAASMQTRTRRWSGASARSRSAEAAPRASRLTYAGVCAGQKGARRGPSSTVIAPLAAPRNPQYLVHITTCAARASAAPRPKTVATDSARTSPTASFPRRFRLFRTATTAARTWCSFTLSGSGGAVWNLRCNGGWKGSA